jgi:hypothetical protein
MEQTIRVERDGAIATAILICVPLLEGTGT